MKSGLAAGVCAMQYCGLPGIVTTLSDVQFHIQTNGINFNLVRHIHKQCSTARLLRLDRLTCTFAFRALSNRSNVSLNRPSVELELLTQKNHSMNYRISLVQSQTVFRRLQYVQVGQAFTLVGTGLTGDPRCPCQCR